MTKIEELRQKLREKGIEFTEEELDGLFTKDGELSEEMLEQAAGGKSPRALKTFKRVIAELSESYKAGEMTEEEFIRKLRLVEQQFRTPIPW